MKDNENLVICQNCIKEIKDTPYTSPFQYRGFYTNFKVPENKLCAKCKCELYETKVTGLEIKTIFNISHDDNFILSMIALKEKDIIEYNLKLSQFKTQLTQEKSVEIQNSNQPKCPICNSTNLSKISVAKKATKIGLFGIFGAGDLGKAWKCNNCGSKF